MTSLGSSRTPLQLDMTTVPRRPLPHWTLLSSNLAELTAGDQGRTVRVLCFERLEPSRVNNTQMAAPYVPRHRNSYDVFVMNVELPGNVSGLDQLDELGGELLYRPEGLLFEGGVPMSQGLGPPNEDFVQINLYVHTEGPSGEPLLTFDRVETLLDRLATELPGEFLRERGVCRRRCDTRGTRGVLGGRNGSTVHVSRTSGPGRCHEVRAEFLSLARCGNDARCQVQGDRFV